MLSQKQAWVAATLDTKTDEALYICHLLEAAGLSVNLADLSTKDPPSTSAMSRSSSTLHLRSAAEVAASHPKGVTGVFCRDRGTAIAAMTDAFERFIKA